MKDDHSGEVGARGKDGHRWPQGLQWAPWAWDTPSPAS